MHTSPDDEGEIAAYLQLFTSGVIETATADPLTLEKEGERAGLWLPMGAFERWLWESVPSYLRFQATDLEVDFPVVLMVSLLGAEGARLAEEGAVQLRVGLGAEAHDIRHMAPHPH